MKKIFIAIFSVMICLFLVGCGGSGAALSSSINSKMNKLEQELTTFNTISNSDIALFDANQLVEVGAYGFNVTNINRNTDTYGNFYNPFFYGRYGNNTGMYGSNSYGYGGLGSFPMNGNYGYGGNFGGNYGNNGFYGNGNYSFGSGYLGTNIDTYRNNPNNANNSNNNRFYGNGNNGRFIGGFGNGYGSFGNQPNGFYGNNFNGNLGNNQYYNSTNNFAGNNSNQKNQGSFNSNIDTYKNSQISRQNTNENIQNRNENNTNNNIIKENGIIVNQSNDGQPVLSNDSQKNSNDKLDNNLNKNKNFRNVNSYKRAKKIATNKNTKNIVNENFEYEKSSDNYKLNKISVITNDANLKNINYVCGSCLGCNTDCSNLIWQIEQHIDYLRDLSKKIKNSDIKINENQALGINDLLNNITASCNKINMDKAELNSELASVKTLKGNIEGNTDVLSAKYVRLLSCLDNRNCNLQAILNSLVQIESCINNESLNLLPDFNYADYIYNAPYYNNPSYYTYGDIQPQFNNVNEINNPTINSETPNIKNNANYNNIKLSNYEKPTAEGVINNENLICKDCKDCPNCLEREQTNDIRNCEECRICPDCKDNKNCEICESLPNYENSEKCENCNIEKPNTPNTIKIKGDICNNGICNQNQQTFQNALPRPYVLPDISKKITNVYENDNINNNINPQNIDTKEVSTKSDEIIKQNLLKNNAFSLPKFERGEKLVLNKKHEKPFKSETMPQFSETTKALKESRLINPPQNTPITEPIDNSEFKDNLESNTNIETNNINFKKPENKKDYIKNNSDESESNLADKPIDETFIHESVQNKTINQSVEKEIEASSIVNENEKENNKALTA